MEKYAKDPLSPLSLNKDSIIKSIHSILQDIIKENLDKSKAKKIEEQKSISFYTRKIPTISIVSYLERILKYSKMEESTLVIMLIFIDNLCETSNFLLTDNNIHR